MNITEKIILLLNEKGISVAKMMKELGFSSGLFSQWKLGKQKPSGEKMFKVQNLFKIIEEKGISAKKLSDDTGISTGNISDWKSGRCCPSINALIIIADYFDISLDYLVGRTNDPILHKK